MIFLLEQGLNINAKNSAGKSALLMAIEYNQLDVVTLLVTNGATINLSITIGDNKNINSFIFAMLHNKIAIAEYLIQQACNFNLHDQRAINCISEAAYSGHDKLVTLFIERLLGTEYAQIYNELYKKNLFTSANFAHCIMLMHVNDMISVAAIKGYLSEMQNQPELCQSITMLFEQGAFNQAIADDKKHAILNTISFLVEDKKENLLMLLDIIYKSNCFALIEMIISTDPSSVTWLMNDKKHLTKFLSWAKENNQEHLINKLQLEHNIANISYSINEKIIKVLEKIHKKTLPPKEMNEKYLLSFHKICAKWKNNTQQLIARINGLIMSPSNALMKLEIIIYAGTNHLINKQSYHELFKETLYQYIKEDKLSPNELPGKLSMIIQSLFQKMDKEVLKHTLNLKNDINAIIDEETVTINNRYRDAIEDVRQSAYQKLNVQSQQELPALKSISMFAPNPAITLVDQKAARNKEFVDALNTLITAITMNVNEISETASRYNLKICLHEIKQVSPFISNLIYIMMTDQDTLDPQDKAQTYLKGIQDSKADMLKVSQFKRFDLASLLNQYVKTIEGLQKKHSITPW